jgi:hypothetical protein
MAIVLTALISKAGAQDIKVVSVNKYISNCIYNFSRYINWPEERKSGDFIITIVGSKEVYNEISRLTQSMKVGLQPIHIKYAASVNELGGFQHIVFINDWQSGKIGTVKQRTSGSSTLIVTETEGMIGRGSMINFIPVNGLMEFEISQDNLRKNRLTASTVLERMAYSSN